MALPRITDAEQPDSPVAVIDAVLACQATGTMPTADVWSALRRLRNDLAELHESIGEGACRTKGAAPGAKTAPTTDPKNRQGDYP